MKNVTILLFIASVILCAYSFNTLFLVPAKRSRQMFYLQSDFYGLLLGVAGVFMSHEFEPLYSFVEIIFSLLLILMRVFSKYLIRINPL